MRRRIEVEDLTSMMRDNEKAIEHAERHRRNREEIEGSHHLSMIVEECQPTLGLHVVSPLLQPLQIARHRGFRYLESELQEFTVDARRAPPRVIAFHTTNQLPKLFTDLGTTTWLGSGPRHRHNSRKPARCQDTTVSEFTMIRVSAHPDHQRRRATQNNRSSRCRRGRDCLRLKTTSC